MQTVLQTNLPLKLVKRGKVRDIYEIDKKHLLIIATDRISAFDHVMHEGIPGRGKILTAISIFWFRYFERFQIWKIQHHFLHDHVFHIGLPAKIIHENDLLGRSMIVRKMDAVIPVECIVRGYLAGSAWMEYSQFGTLAGTKMPAGLKEGSRIPKDLYPLFTPSTKEENGHDRSLTKEGLIQFLSKWKWPSSKQRIGREAAHELARFLEHASQIIYFVGMLYAPSKKILIADTKFEFGVCRNTLYLIDEVLTPDSSRFWDIESWQPGHPQQNFDKQYLRDWLIGSNWDQNFPPPNLPQAVIEETASRYQEVAHRLVDQRVLNSMNTELQNKTQGKRKR